MIKLNSKIFIAGHNGLVGSSIHQLLKKKKYKKLLVRTRSQLDLTNSKKVDFFFKKNKPEFIVICAAKVGGILENSRYPTEFIINNLLIQNNILMAAKKYKVKRTIFLGSSCIYPKNSKIPIKEDYLLTGKLEETNQAYAIAKIAGLKLCESIFKQYKKDIVGLMPTNVYGIKDNFDSNSSHVIPGMITKFLNAKNKNKNVYLWGSGKPIREFIYDEDLASAIFLILKLPQKKILKVCKNKFPIINVGTGQSYSIKRLATLIGKLINFKGKIIFDRNFPDGTIDKSLNTKKLRKLSWKPKISFKLGLKRVINSQNI